MDGMAVGVNALCPYREKCWGIKSIMKIKGIAFAKNKRKDQSLSNSRYDEYISLANNMIDVGIILVLENTNSYEEKVERE